MGWETFARAPQPPRLAPRAYALTVRSSFREASEPEVVESLGMADVLAQVGESMHEEL